MRNPVIPVIIAMIVFGFFGIMSLAFVVQRCGPQGLLYGNGAVWVAASGVCDK